MSVFGLNGIQIRQAAKLATPAKNGVPESPCTIINSKNMAGNETKIPTALMMAAVLRPEVFRTETHVPIMIEEKMMLNKYPTPNQ